MIGKIGFSSQMMSLILFSRHPFPSNLPARMNNNQPLSNQIRYEACSLPGFYTDSKVADAIANQENCYPIHRSLSFAARSQVEEIMDEIALADGWIVQRTNSYNVLIQQGDCLATGHGYHTGEYCSCYFSFQGNSVAEVEAMKNRIEELVEDCKINEPMYSIDWYFLTSKGELQEASIKELADDILHDQAYPNLEESVDEFVDAFMASKESVLVLQGPPGTGKTRLIRYILGALSKAENSGHASAMYTTDNKALTNDEIFVKFITGYDLAFVVEDADHLLSPRSEGNEHLHRFLSIADGVIRAQRRKIIFSTNLPDISDLDEALIRPGRCYRHLVFRNLNQDEAIQLLTELNGGDGKAARERILQESDKEQWSLAEIYQLN